MDILNQDGRTMWKASQTPHESAFNSSGVKVKVDKSINLRNTADEGKYEGVDCGGNMGLVECCGWINLGAPIHGS
ncbi:hypothetical protein MRB53_013224 [Persea americana]|uniref:Uncharacterized protein n=1 Tax=Persea americana TaxID=3435 RepID=A0ACC2K807_PERAE|nr:hypothetical protein MRB53_013224 [Persea americana]